MKVAAKGAIWYADSSYHERMIPKAAGWWWHGGGCRTPCAACDAGLPLRFWWTSDRDRAARLAEYADAETKATLERAAAVHTAALAASRATDAAIEIPAPAGRSYRPFQKAGIAYALGRQGTLIGDEMGLGKTVMAIGVMNADPSIESVLIVCPATLRMNWWQELRRWDVRPRNVLVPEGRALPGKYDKIVIVNYEKLIGVNGRRLHARLMERQWDLLVVDEAHRLKDMKTQRTMAVLGGHVKATSTFTGGKEEITPAHDVPGLAAKARRRVFLTGTPIPNRPEEIFPLLHNLAPEAFPSYWKFVKRYCDAHHNGYGFDKSGASRLDELQDRMRATCMIRRLKKDVLTELPPKIRQIVELDPAGAGDVVAQEQEAYAAHEERLADLRADVDLAHAAGDEAAYKAAVMALRQGAGAAFTQIAKLRKATAVAKVPQVIEHVDAMLEEGGKVVVMAHHHEVVHAFAAHWGAAAVTLTGETPMADRIQLVARFQSEDAVRVFIGSITAAGVGITLTAASRVVFAELDWVPGNMTQAEDRCHRIGQTDSVLVQHCVLSGSLDAQMAQTLIAKQQLADDALDVEHDRSLPVVPSAPAAEKPKKYPKVSEARRRILHEAMMHLASVCDGADQRDGSGFSRYDAKVGHSLAGAGHLSDGQAWLAGKLATKYRRQLSQFPAALENVTEDTEPVAA